MPIPSDKPPRACKFCNKEVVNMATHIINQHPSILEQLDERIPETSPSFSNIPTPPTQNKPIYTDINTMIREKLDTMLNIKIIEMLSANKDMSLVELKNAVAPPQQTTLDDLKKYHDIFYKTADVVEDGGGKWIELATAALPMIAQMLPKKQEELKKNDTEHRTTEAASPRIRRLISQEITGNTGITGNTSGESGAINGAEQQNNSVDKTISGGTQ
jgi:hypothetical protein